MAIEKQKLILISGVVLGVVAILMTKVYLDQQQQEAQAQARRSLAKMQANQSVVLVAKQDVPSRSEERRVGTECLRLCRSRWSPSH